MWKNLVLAVLCFVVCSCGSEHERAVLEFDSSVEVAAEILSEESLMLNYPFDMFVTDSLICVLGLTERGWIHCYDRFTGSYKGTCIANGRGPGELLLCTKLFYVPADKELYLYDTMQKKFATYEVSDVEPYVSFVEEKSYADLTGVEFMNIWPLGNGAVLVNSQCGPMTDSLTRFQVMNDDVVVCTCSDMPELGGDDRYTYVQSYTTMSPDRCHLASATFFGEILEIYDVADSSVERVVENIYSVPNVTFRDGVLWESEQTIWGFPYVTSDDDHIYAVMTHGKDARKHNDIAVFDWQGKGLLKVTADYNVLRLAPYENGLLYAVVVDSSSGFYLASIRGL